MTIWQKILALLNDAPPPPVVKLEGLALCSFRDVIVTALSDRVTGIVIISDTKIELSGDTGIIGAICFKSPEVLDDLLLRFRNHRLEITGKVTHANS